MTPKIKPGKKWAKGGTPRGPRLAKMGVQKGKFCCNRQIPSGAWRFCPFCGRELYGLDLQGSKGRADPQVHLNE